KTYTTSFDMAHLPQVISFIILSGIVGYLFGKIIIAHRAINEQQEKFSIIGTNLSGMMHDHGSPLANILMNVHLLESKISDKNQIRHCEWINKEAARVLKMMMDIKLVASGAKTIKLSMAPIDLKPFLKNVISKMSLRCAIGINSKFEGKVLVDKDYFERVIWNLVKNADEAVEGIEDGEIRISTSKAGNSVLICISDNGPGITPKNLKSIFELGQTYDKRKGAGIGLYNCKKIVESHKGKIWITSEVNKGTNVYIKIPMKD
ncbi:MAG: sensor histidine kinase, partial [Candidatus Omnitrophota bacterium]